MEDIGIIYINWNNNNIDSKGQKPSPRYRHDGIVILDSMYLFGGVNEKKHRFNDLYSYVFSTKEWY